MTGCCMSISESLWHECVKPATQQELSTDARSNFFSANNIKAFFAVMMQLTQGSYIHSQHCSTSVDAV